MVFKGIRDSGFGVVAFIPVGARRASPKIARNEQKLPGGDVGGTGTLIALWGQPFGHVALCARVIVNLGSLSLPALAKNMPPAYFYGFAAASRPGRPSFMLTFGIFDVNPSFVPRAEP